MADSSGLVRVGIAAVWVVQACVGLHVPLAAQIGPDRDTWIEQCLKTGKVLGRGQALKGITRPRKVTVECDGERRVAVFKTHESFRRGLTRFGDGSWEMNFSDSFRYERAAYLLDRELGLDMVPVAILRSIGRERGVLVDWVYGHHRDDPSLTVTSQLVVALASQKACMRIFDALIYNVDRNPTNWMVDASERLYLIDHSRSFRTSPDLPLDFSNQRIWLSRNLYQELQNLSRDRLGMLLDDLLEPAQIDAILHRRDRIVVVVESARSRLGDNVIFHD